jgi:hypothetical protein
MQKTGRKRQLTSIMSLLVRHLELSHGTILNYGFGKRGKQNIFTAT